MNPSITLGNQPNLSKPTQSLLWVLALSASLSSPAGAQSQVQLDTSSSPELRQWFYLTYRTNLIHAITQAQNMTESDWAAANNGPTAYRINSEQVALKLKSQSKMLMLDFCKTLNQTVEDVCAHDFAEMPSCSATYFHSLEAYGSLEYHSTNTCPMEPQLNLVNTLTYSAVEERIQKIIMEVLHVNADQVTPNTSFVEDLNADSLDVVDLILAVEKEFNIRIPDDEAAKMTIPANATAYVFEHQ